MISVMADRRVGTPSVSSSDDEEAQGLPASLRPVPVVAELLRQSSSWAERRSEGDSQSATFSGSHRVVDSQWPELVAGSYNQGHSTLTRTSARQDIAAQQSQFSRARPYAAIQPAPTWSTSTSTSYHPGASRSWSNATWRRNQSSAYRPFQASSPSFADTGARVPAAPAAQRQSMRGAHCGYYGNHVAPLMAPSAGAFSYPERTAQIGPTNAESNTFRNPGISQRQTYQQHLSEKSRRAHYSAVQPFARAPVHYEAPLRRDGFGSSATSPVERRPTDSGPVPAVPGAGAANARPKVTPPEEAAAVGTRRPSISSHVGVPPKRLKTEEEPNKLDLLCTATLELGPLQDNPTGCSCPRSNCIKLYCDCFKAGRRCAEFCSCINCKNTEATQVERTQAIKNILARNPRAFTGGKREAVPRAPGDIVCNCLKSRCLKLYCDCFHNGRTCNEACACVQCLNIEAESGEGGRRKLAMQQALEKRPDAFVIKAKEVGSGCACKNNRCLKRYCDCFRFNLPCTDKCTCRQCGNGKPQPGSSGRALGRVVPV
jgi:hypothetical protein